MSLYRNINLVILSTYKLYNNCTNNLIKTMFEAWNSFFIKPLLIENSSNDKSLNNNKCKDNNYIKTEIIDSFLTESYRIHYGFKSFESALTILTITKKLDCRFQGIEFDQYFNLLNQIVSSHFTQKSFEGKNVICIEGLEGSGKSTLIYNLTNGCSNIKTYTRTSNQLINHIREIISHMPIIILKAFEFLNLYLIAYDILITNQQHHSSSLINNENPSVFIIEDYYHYLFSSNICENNITEYDIQQLDSNVFEWPYDLPKPDFIIYLAIPTNIRLKRIQSSIINIDYKENNLQTNSRRSSAMVNDRITRFQQKDSKANLVYSLIRGPGTVGIDANVSMEELVTITLEALEYYGVYAISRYYIYHPITLIISTNSSSICNHNDNSEDRIDKINNNNIPLREITNQISHSQDNNIILNNQNNNSLMESTNENYSSNSKLTNNNTHNNNNARKFSSPKQLPQLPDEMIINRRISMGVYGVFTKF